MSKQIVHTTSLFKVDDSFKDERFCRVRIAVMHTGTNLNNSSFSLNSIKNAKSTFANVPILANIMTYVDEDGTKHLDYGGHDMHLEDDLYNEGEQRMIYDEKIVGIVPEHNNFEIIHDDETNEDYVYVDALLYRDYGNYAVDILEERGGMTSISCEIICNEIAYKKNIIDIKDFTMTGITLLGEDVKPAMKKANATMFSISDEDKNKQLIDIMQELTKAFENYTSAINADLQLGKEKKEMNKFEELLAKYSISAEDVTFEWENLSDSQLEEKFEEVFGEKENQETPSEEQTNESTEDFSDDNTEESSEETDVVENEEATNDNDEADENASENYDEDSSNENFEQENTIQFSMSYGNEKMEFATSLSEKLYALSQLVNAQYEVDQTWYSVDAYDEPKKYVVMQDVFSGRAFKQDYKIRSGEYMLVGDRTEVFAQFLTEDEIKELDSMRNNYSVMESKLNAYESEPDKIELINSEDYAQIRNTEEFAEISKRENYFEMSKEDLTKKLDNALLNFAKNNKINFSVKDETDTKKTVGVVKFASGKVSTSRGRYGGIFKKED